MEPYGEYRPGEHYHENGVKQFDSSLDKLQVGTNNFGIEAHHEVMQINICITVTRSVRVDRLDGDGS